MGTNRMNRIQRSLGCMQMNRMNLKPCYIYTQIEKFRMYANDRVVRLTIQLVAGVLVTRKYAD